MMPRPLKAALSTLILSLAAQSAHSGMMIAELYGTTFDSTDGLGLYTSGGATSFDGRTATLTFTYELSDVPGDANASPTIADFSSFTDWISASVTISGPTTTINEEDWGDATADLSDADGIYFNDMPGAYEYNIFSNDIDFDGLNFDNALFFAELVDTEGDWLPILDPGSEFIWDNNDLSGVGISYFRLENQLGFSESSILFNYLEVRAAPAPAGLFLLLLGLTGLSLRQLRQLRRPESA